MNWYKFATFTKLASEYWLIDGQAVFADGDVGDMNHEMYVTESICSKYDIDQSVLQDGTAFSKWAVDNAELVINYIKTHYSWEPQYQKLLDQNNISALMDEFESDGIMGVDIVFDLMGVPEGQEREVMLGRSDVRLYGIQNLGWVRVQGFNIEAWQLDSSTIKNIKSGMDQVLDESGKDEEFNPLVNIFTFGNNSWFNNVPLNLIGSPKQIKEYMTMQNGNYI